MDNIIDLKSKMKIVIEEGRTEIGLFEHLTTTLGNPTDQDSLETQWIRSIVARYNEVVCRNCPSFEEHEWFMLLFILGDPVLNVSDPLESNWEYLANYDDPELGLPVDHKELADRIRAMSYEQQCAIVEVATLFWARKKDGDDLRELLRQVGAKIKG